MVPKWKKYVDKVVQGSSRKTIAEDIENIIAGRNLSLYDIKPLQGTKNQFRVRLGNYRIIFEKTESENKILKINKRGDMY